MPKKVKKTLLRYLSIVLPALILLSGAAAVQAAAAGEEAGIKVTPVKIDTDLKPGETGRVEMTVINTGRVPVKLSLESQDFTRDVEGNYRFFTENERPPAASAASWLALARPRGTLEPGQSKSVRAKIKVPKKAEPGAHFAMVFILGDPVPGKARHKGAVVIGRPRIGVMVRATVQGKIVDKADFSKLEAARFNWGGPVGFELLFANKGNVHKDIAGRVTVTNNGGTVAKITVNEWTSLPGSDLRIRTAWIKPALGSFKATAVMASRDGEEWKRSTSFYVFPLRQALSGAALVLLVLGLWRFLGGRYSFRIERREGNSD